MKEPRQLTACCPRARCSKPSAGQVVFLLPGMSHSEAGKMPEHAGTTLPEAAYSDSQFCQTQGHKGRPARPVWPENEPRLIASIHASYHERIIARPGAYRIPVIITANQRVPSQGPFTQEAWRQIKSTAMGLTRLAQFFPPRSKPGSGNFDRTRLVTPTTRASWSATSEISISSSSPAARGFY